MSVKEKRNGGDKTNIYRTGQGKVYRTVRDRYDSWTGQESEHQNLKASVNQVPTTPMCTLTVRK